MYLVSSIYFNNYFNDSLWIVRKAVRIPTNRCYAIFTEICMYKKSTDKEKTMRILVLHHVTKLSMQELVIYFVQVLNYFIKYNNRHKRRAQNCPPMQSTMHKYNTILHNPPNLHSA